MATYQVTRVASRKDFLERLDTLPKAYITHYPWNCGFRPESYACLAWDGENIHLYMRSYEKSPRDEIECDNGDIYLDSCLEFFINPVWESHPDFFINFEMNPRRYLYLAEGDPVDRNLLSLDGYDHFGLEILEKGAWQGKEYWDICAQIPMSFFTELLPDFKPEPGMQLKGNFFKCGDATPVPHFGCWCDIRPADPEPFFYRPDCFGTLLFL